MASETPVDHSLGPVSPHDHAVRLLGQKCFHQCFWLPATERHERLRVTFATTTNFDDNGLPVILFIGPMFGTRYFCLQFDKIARESGVRVICVDRPGIGGSTSVPIEQRISVWIETVPQLLRHLAVEQVSLVSHSAGTMYMLNTLYHLRDILHKRRPRVALLAPWVSQEHSHQTLLNAASKLPSAAFSGWSSLVGFVNNNLAPVSAWSGGILSSSLDLFQPHPAPAAAETSSRAMYGTDDATAKLIATLQAQYAWAEGMDGANDEARLCLRARQGLWGVCEDFHDYVRLFCAQEQARARRDTGGVEEELLHLAVFFAESDALIGKTGTEYFRACWSQACVGGVVAWEDVQLPGTNHETVLMDLEKGGIRKVLGSIGETFSCG